MNKEIPVKVKIIIETDYRYKYSNMFAPKFIIIIHNGSVRITHSCERHWASSSVKYLDYLKEPMLLTSYVPDETITTYVIDRGACKLMKYIGNGNFDYNYNRIKKKLTYAIDELYNKYKITFNINLAKEIYEAFVYRYLQSPIGEVNLYYFGTRIVNYIINKDKIEIEEVINESCRN